MSRIGIALALLLPALLEAQSSRSFLVTHATVIDGGGGPPIRAAVRVTDGRIAAIGDLAPRPGEQVVDAHDLALAPGFIDNHSHHDGALHDQPDALGAVSQGITTIVVGQDGFSNYPLREYFKALEAAPAAVNVASYAGHNTIRDLVLGSDFRREASGEEVGRMRLLLRQELAAGALGLSSGLEYDPGIYSSRSEVLALAQTASVAGGRYISHIRSEDRNFWDAIDEIITIGREAKLPVQISHIKLAMRPLWGHADSLVALLDAARREGIQITADIYPYPYWHSTLTVLFPKRDFTDRAEAEIAVNQVSTPQGLRLGTYRPNPEFAGLTLAEIAPKLGMDSVSALIELVRRAEAMRAEGMDDVENVIGTSMTEPDIERLLQWSEMSFCTDGELDGTHPRGFGSYPRLLGRYVRERGVLSLPEAVRRATGLAAEHVGISDRGRIQAGQMADLVLFDPAAIIDRATTDDPHALSVGIVTVWVNGEVVFTEGRTTGRHPGMVLRRGGTAR
ncbi:MAG: D-aminoacylase [Gemmatimonadota bacterium]